MTIEEKSRSEVTGDYIQDEFLRTGDWARALAERTARVDSLVLTTAEECLFPSVPGGLAVLAVGGYGRRELFPHSDIDVLLLFESDRAAEASRAAVGVFVQRVWDARLRLSQSVRTPAECAELHDRNLELNISLLDQRFLAGDRLLYAKLAEALPRFIHAQRDALMGHLSRLSRERHSKYQDTYYHLEPNIKEGPGGMRDYQLIQWLAAIRQSGEESLPELRDPFAFLARLRCYLHCWSGRDSNALTFDAQECAAEQWRVAEPAVWMREYFRHARAVSRAAMRALDASEGQHSGLLSSFRDWRSRLSNSDFSVSRERLYFRAPLRMEADPELLLRAFEFVARHGVRFSGEAERRIMDRLPRFKEWFAESRPMWPELKRIFNLPWAPAALRAMHETGVLGVIFPEFDEIECLVIRDFFHRYTVDEHTLVAIRNLCSLRKAEEPPLRQFSDLFTELEDPAPLIFALLFHDVGKSNPDAPHVEGSLEAAESAMMRIQMPPRDRDTVRFLVERHLTMPSAMQSRDLSDPSAATELAELIGTVERLKALTLMSYADVSAVHPEVMTAWRAEHLWREYMVVYNQLTRELDVSRVAPSVPFLAGFPARYLRTHTEQEIQEHLALEELSHARGVAVEVKKLDNAWRLTLVTGDRPGLFASVAGTLSAFGLNILKAEAFANRTGTVLDTFTFEDPLRSLQLNPSEVDRLRVTAERVIRGKMDVAKLLQNRPKPVPPSRRARVKPTVAFDDEASSIATLIQIVAEDRPGLLYDLTSGISAEGCNIEVVLIDTEAHKAIDVFYVTANGAKLPASRQEKLAAALRKVCGVE